MKEQIKYLNGNYIVKLREYGFIKEYRSLRVGEEFISKFPDSIDLKITDKCSIGCPYCHESSSTLGESFNVNKTIKLLNSLPKVGIELAIGGGDVLDRSLTDNLKKLILWCSQNNFLCRFTVNIKSLLRRKSEEEKKYKGPKESVYFSITDDSDLSDLFINNVRAFGISIEKYDKSFDCVIRSCREMCNSFVVFHVIVGIIPPEDIVSMINDGRSVLILGYKYFGRGKTYSPKYSIEETGRIIKREFLKQRLNILMTSGIVGFDNLAIEQLGIKDCLTSKEWNKLYMGDEFTHSMYVDAVNEEFAPTSRDQKRDSWNNYPGGIVEYFIKNKK